MISVAALEYEEAEPVSQEEVAILHWRTEELERAGYGTLDAVELAARTDVDLRRACDLLARGCPLELALRILL